MDKNNARKAGEVALKVAGIGIGIWAILILADIATFYWVFGKMSTMLAARGMDSNLANVCGIAFAVFSGFAAHGSLWLLLTRKTHLWALKLGAIMLVWYGAMYAVSYPYSGKTFDMWTGKAQVKSYHDHKNRIVLVPKGAVSGPEGQPIELIDEKTAGEYAQQDLEKVTLFNIYTGLPQFKYYLDSKKRIVKSELAAKTGPEGQPLQVFDQKTAEEYTQQGVVEEKIAAVGPSLKPNNVASGRANGSSGLEIWVEKIQLATDRTILHLACKTNDPRYNASILFPDGGLEAYLVDDSGNPYDVMANSTGTTINRKPRTIREGETYRFSLAFSPLPQGASKLKIRLHDFEPALDLDSIFAKAEKVQTILPSQAPGQVVSSLASDNLVLWAEKITVGSGRTTIYLACRGKDTQADGWLKPNSYVNSFFWNGQSYQFGPPTMPYLVDDSGQPYSLSSDSVVYDSVYTWLEDEGWFSRKEQIMPAHYVRVDEIYHFTLAFPSLKEGVSELQLHLPWFSPALKLTSALAKAEKVPPVGAQTP